MAEFVGRLSQNSNPNPANNSKFVGRLASTEIKPKEPTLGGQILRGIVSPTATLLARPVQLAATALGATPEQINKVNLNGYIAPVPMNASDVVKDVGRGIQTVTMGKIPKISSALDIIGGGAVAGAGYALEQKGSDVKTKDILVNSALGGTLGAGLYGAGKVIPKIFPKKGASNVVDDVVESTTKQADDVNIPTKERIDTTGMVFRQRPEGVTQDVRTVMSNLDDAGYNRKTTIPKIMQKLYANNPTGQFTREEVSAVIQDFKPTRKVKPKGEAIIKIKNDKPLKRTLPTQATDEVFDNVGAESKIFNEATDSVNTKGAKNQYDFNEQQYTRADDFATKTDPTFKSGGMASYKEAFNKLSREDIIDISVGVKQAPPEIPSTAVKALAKELPDLTKAEQRRLAKSTFVQSKAGSDLSSARYLKNETITDPYTYSELKHKELIDNALKKKYTNKTINRFLDDLGCK